MSPVLEAIPSQTSMTTSHYYNEWLGFLDGTLSIANRQVHFPELSVSIVERPDGNWVLVNGDTSTSGKAIKSFSSDIIDDIDSPTMPARKQFIISLIVDRIEKGKPSFCDEVEQ